MAKSDQPIGFTVDGVLALAGGKQAVADALGLTLQAVCGWKTRIPSKHARQVAIMAGLPLAIVRPDMVQEAASQIS